MEEIERRSGIERRQGRGWSRAVREADYGRLVQSADLALLSVLFVFLAVVPAAGSVSGLLRLKVPFGGLVLLLFSVVVWAFTLRYAGVYRKHLQLTKAHFIRSLVGLNACTLEVAGGAHLLGLRGDLWSLTGHFWFAALLGMTLLRAGLIAYAVARYQPRDRRRPAVPPREIGRVIAFDTRPPAPIDAR